MSIRIVSFGYGHGPVPAADLTIDLRATLRNPFHNPELKHSTGLEQDVYEHVRDTPGAEGLAARIAFAARCLAEDTDRTVTIAWGCTGGRHRAVGMARLSYESLKATGDAVTIEHRDVEKPLLPPGIHARH